MGHPVSLDLVRDMKKPSFDEFTSSWEWDMTA